MADKNDNEDVGMHRHYRHGFKCLDCGLHFFALSWWPDWPLEGTTELQNTGKTSGAVYCPECGSKQNVIRMREDAVEHPIFQYC